MKEYINEALKQYTENGKYPWHMPGHKRKSIGDDFFDNMMKRDFTEARGLDDMHDPELFMKETLKELTELYGTRATYMMVNGSTGGVLAAIYACTNYGDHIIVARNCHKSVYNAIEINGLVPHYIVPDVESHGICRAVDPETVKAEVAGLLKTGIVPKAVVITSPTYEGIISDIPAIKAAIKSACGLMMKTTSSNSGNDSEVSDVPLIVDGAHGAHLPFYNMFCGETSKYNVAVGDSGADKGAPIDGVSGDNQSVSSDGASGDNQSVSSDGASGDNQSVSSDGASEDNQNVFIDVAGRNHADIYIESTHKTLPALTQTGLIHVNNDEYVGRLEKYLKIFQSSSPSYLFIQSIEKSISYALGNPQAWEQYRENIRKFRNEMSELKNLTLFELHEEGKVKNAAVAEEKCEMQDYTRLVICAPMGGRKLEQILDDKYGLVVEMAAGSYVILITSVMDEDNDFDRLFAALKEIDQAEENEETVQAKENGEAVCPEENEKLVQAKENEKTACTEEHQKNGVRCEEDTEANKVKSRLFVPEMKCSPSQVESLAGASELVRLSAAKGAIAREYVFAYPPGIPVVVPGEIISADVIARIQEMVDAELNMTGVHYVGGETEIYLECT